MWYKADRSSCTHNLCRVLKYACAYAMSNLILLGLFASGHQ
jgi:hypothetical protein